MAKPIKRQRWTNIDAFGLINGISIWDDQYRNLKYVRRPFETGLNVKDKIFRNLDNPPSTTKQGIINGLSNEFSLTPYNITKKNTFTLSFNPIPVGPESDPDIKCYYRTPGSTSWTELVPQIWSSTYQNAKKDKRGFIVWQRERYSNDPNIKNFSYSRLVEVLHDFPDKTELKFVYKIYSFNNSNEKILVDFTDMSHPYDSEDTRFLYRAKESFDLSSQIVAYSLDDIPDSLHSKYYDGCHKSATEFFYSLKRYFDEKFKHKWGELQDSTAIWDVHKYYGSGEIPHFYDAIAPENQYYCDLLFSGMTGGIETNDESLYLNEIIETGNAQSWYARIYPGRFYIDGIPFYYFENPQSGYLDLSSGSGLIPSGLTRGMYTIMALSGYYDDYCTNSKDEYLPNVFEDYAYPIGYDASTIWTNIYRRRPYLTSQMGLNIDLQDGEYSIDFRNGCIHAEGVSGVMIIWDKVLQPSGRLLNFDLNPLNEDSLAFEKFFLYLSIDPNRTL